MYIEGGTYPDVFAYKVNMSCNHCAEPACLPTCPDRRDLEAQEGRHRRYRLDAVHRLPALRGGLPLRRAAVQSRSRTSFGKCNLCVDEIEAGRKPYCVMACMMRVLDIGPIDKLRDGKYKTKAIGPHDKLVRQVKSWRIRN